MKTYYTYLWLRKDGTPYYAGKGTGDRAFVQKSHRFPPPPQNRILLQEFPDESSAFIAEVFLIAVYGREDLGTGCLLNLTDGGENPPNQQGKPRSLETIKNMAAAQRKKFADGWTFSDVTRLRMHVAKAGKPGNNKGRHWTHSVPRSDEHRRKLRELNLGKCLSDETRKKLSLSLKGRVPWNKGSTGGKWSAARRAAFDNSRKMG